MLAHFVSSRYRGGVFVTDKPKPHVFVAGPLNTGEQPWRNVRVALDVASRLQNLGVVPFVPHLCVFWDLAHEQTEKAWRAYDMAWLSRCDAVFRVSGRSPGADAEVARARELGLCVFLEDDGYSPLVRWAATWGAKKS
jgi:hypothetical protein